MDAPLLFKQTFLQRKSFFHDYRDLMSKKDTQTRKLQTFFPKSRHTDTKIVDIFKLATEELVKCFSKLDTQTRKMQTFFLKSRHTDMKIVDIFSQKQTHRHKNCRHFFSKVDMKIVDIFFQKQTHRHNNCRHIFLKVDTQT